MLVSLLRRKIKRKIRQLTKVPNHFLYNPVKIKINIPFPLEIEFSNNVCISSRQNIILQSGKILHLNPEYEDQSPVALKDINCYNETLFCNSAIDINSYKVNQSLITDAYSIPNYTTMNFSLISEIESRSCQPL